MMSRIIVCPCCGAEFEVAAPKKVVATVDSAEAKQIAFDLYGIELAVEEDGDDGIGGR